MPLTIVPDPNKPLPDDFDSEDTSSFLNKVKIAAATAKVLFEAGAETPITEKDKEEAKELFKAFTNPDQTAPPPVSNKALNHPPTVQHLFTMLDEYDHQVVDEAVQLRRFVTNKLLEDTGLSDPRHRLKALELLGKISDVGLFTEKTEVTIKNIDLGDIENQIRTKLFKILGNSMAVDTSFEVVDAEEVPVNPDPAPKE